MHAIRSAVFKCLTGAAIAVLVVVCAACAGHSPAANPEATFEAADSDAAADGDAAVAGPPSLGGPPVDEYVDPAVIAERRGSVLGEFTIAGPDCLVHSAHAVAGPDTMVLNPGDPAPAWALYEFAENTGDDAPWVLALDLGMRTAGNIHLGIADYGTGTWHWTALGNAGPENFTGIPDHIDPVSDGGNIYVVVLVETGGIASIKALTLFRESPAPPPVGLIAGADGIHPGWITLGWEDPAVTYPGLKYDEIAIERNVDDEGWSEIAKVARGVSGFGDIAGPGNEYPIAVECSYRLRTIVAGETGVACPKAVGIRRLGSVAHLSATRDVHPEFTRLGWDPVPGADGYLLEINCNGEWQALVEIDSGNTTEYRHYRDGVPGLQTSMGVGYEYRIRAMWQDDRSPEYAHATGSRGLARIRSFYATQGTHPDRVSLYLYSVRYATGCRIGYSVDGEDIQVLTTLTGAFGELVFDHTYQSPPGHECELDMEYTYYFNPEYYGEAMPWDTVATDTGYRTISAPDLIKASDGDFGEFIRFRWSPQFGSDAMRIYRDGTGPEHLVAELGYTWEWDDYIDDLDEHTYRVLSCWQGIWSELSEPDTGYRNLFNFHSIGEYYNYQLDLEIVDGTPAIALSESDCIKFLHSSVLEPADEYDWSSHLVTETEADCLVSMAVVNGVPAMAICRWRSSGEGVRYARATSASPTAETDWQIHTLAEGEDVFGTISLQVINGLPALCYPSPEYKYARATTLHPGSLADWVICDLPGQNYQPSLVEYLGRPALITYAEPGYSSSIKVLTGTSAEPASSDDWQFHFIGTGYPVCSIAVINSALSVGFNDPQSQFIFGHALTGIPETPEDWQLHLLEPHGNTVRIGSESMVEYEGKPVLCYFSGSALMLARATVAEPVAAGDWLIDRIATGAWGGHDLKVINGKLAIAFTSNYGCCYGIAQE